MESNSSKITLLRTVIRWLARIASLLIFLLWGAFFVEHLTEWFSNPKQLPPLKIWIQMVFHFLLLAGYLLVFKWERIGSLVIIGSAFAFFFSAAGWHGIWFFLIYIIPVVLFLSLEFIHNCKDIEITIPL